MDEAKIMITQEVIEKRPLSASSLKAFRKSPRHYLMYLRKEFVPSDAIILGSVIDVLALTPEEFNNRFVVLDKPNIRTKDGKAEWARMTFEAEQKRLTIITEAQLKTAEKSVEALYSNDQAAELLKHKRNVQRKLKWRHKPTNLPLIGYIDFESRAWGDQFIVDLKSTRSADPDKFNRDAANFDYEIQTAAYLDAYHKLFYQFPNFIFLAVETDEPFNVSVNICDSDYIDRAKAEFYGTLQAFRICMEQFPDFDIGYEFRLLGTRDYFGMSIPKYKKMIYQGFDNK